MVVDERKRSGPNCADRFGRGFPRSMQIIIALAQRRQTVSLMGSIVAVTALVNGNLDTVRVEKDE